MMKNKDNHDPATNLTYKKQCSEAQGLRKGYR